MKKNVELDLKRFYVQFGSKLRIFILFNIKSMQLAKKFSIIAILYSSVY